MSARVPVRVPRRYESSTSQLSSTTSSRGGRRSRGCASQSGTLPHEVRGEDRLRARPDHLLDARRVDLVRVGLDVDEHGHDPRLHHRRDVGGERERGRDDLVAGLQPSRSIASRSADEPEFTITPCCFASSAATRCSNSRAWRRVERREVRNTSTTASISRSSWTAPGSGRRHGRGSLTPHYLPRSGQRAPGRRRVVTFRHS